MIRLYQSSFLFLLLGLVMGCISPGNELPPGEEVVEQKDSAPATFSNKDIVVVQKSPAVPLFPIDYDTALWLELGRLDSTIQADLKYAGSDNFVSEQLYDCGRCFLRPEVAIAVKDVHQYLRNLGFGIKVFDCYRPRPVQWKLWKKVPDPRFVTDPRKGSMHNRGAAVDLTLTDADGQELDMGTPFDYFGQEAYHAYTNLSDSILSRRKMLKETMESHGFRAIRTEWWHYSYRDKSFELSDMLWKCYE